MAGRKRHSAEEIVRKLRRADELAAAGSTGEQIAAELEVSAATLYNWRRSYGGMDLDAAKDLKDLRGSEQPPQAAAGGGGAGERRPAGGGEGKILSPDAKRAAVDMLKRVKGMSERLACKTVGLSRSTYRTPKVADTPQDPDAELRGWLREYSTRHPCHGVPSGVGGATARRGPAGWAWTTSHLARRGTTAPRRTSARHIVGTMNLSGAFRHA